MGHTGKAGKAADKGTICHKVLEILASVKLAIQEGKDYIVDDEVLGKRTLESLTDVGAITDEIYVWYSYHNSYNKWVADDRVDCRSWVKKALYLNAGMFDPRNRTIVSPEKSFDILIDKEWAKYSYELPDGSMLEGQLALKGTIDLITEVDPQLYEIIDWKTGRRWDWNKGKEKTNDSLNKDPQLMIYHYAATKLYPDVEDFLVTINFINDGGPFTIAFTKKDVAKTEDMLRRKFDKIKATRVPRLNRSWKCGRLCHQGKSTFEGTNILPLVEQREGHVTPVGNYMTKCEQVKFEIEKKGIDQVTKEYLAPGHTFGHYKKPGETENVEVTPKV